MKISFIIQRRFLQGQAVENRFKVYAEIVNSSDNYYIEEDLTESDLFAINRSDAVYTRMGIGSETATNILVPIFVQHEIPFMYVGKLSEKFVYLTDSAYVPLYPIAENCPNLIVAEPLISLDKDYDVLYVGRARGAHGLYFRLLKLIIGDQINCFGSVFEIIAKSKWASLVALYRRLASKQNYHRFLWYLNQTVRGLRRDRILDQLRTVARNGGKVVIVGDDATLEKMQHVENVVLYGISKWSFIRNLMARSKIMICTTPLDQSLLNERYCDALQCGSIPLYEPYPQYLNIFPEADDQFVFDYASNSLLEKIENILLDYPSMYTIFQQLREAAGQKFGREVFYKTFQGLIEKYKKNETN